MLFTSSSLRPVASAIFSIDSPNWSKFFAVSPFALYELPEKPCRILILRFFLFLLRYPYHINIRQLTYLLYPMIFVFTKKVDKNGIFIFSVCHTHSCYLSLIVL